jgi:hemoglobin/transferrin/lactoferrin receptor protein
MKSVLSVVLVSLAFTTTAQFAEREYNESDTTITSYLDEVVVSANKIPEQRRTVAQQIKVISEATVKSFNAQTSADLLQNTGVVAMQRSQQGGGSPILRGFEASRVLLMIDGVRMNNLIYRAGHLQNAITVDNNMLERAEVLFGPSSTVYGSDALGGVVHFYTKNPEFGTEEGKALSGNAFVRYGSANEEKAGHVDVSIGGRRLASLTSFTYSDFGDLRMGERTNPSLGEQFGVRNQYVVRAPDNQSDQLVDNDEPLVQKLSGYRQWDVLQKFIFKQSERLSHTLNVQYSTSTNVPRYDRLTDPGSNGTGLRFAEWYYGPQERLMVAYNIQVNNLGKIANQLTATISYQAIEESRHDRQFNVASLNSRVENVNVWGITIDFNKIVGNHNIRYGFDGQFNSLSSTAYRTDVVSGVRGSLNTRYPDGDNSLNAYALFATYTFKLSDVASLNSGVRFAASRLYSTFSDATYFPDNYYSSAEQQLNYVSGNLGFNYTPSSWKFSILAGTGYRVPNIDDALKVNDNRIGTASRLGILVIPNPDLKPEQTLNGDFSVTKFFGDIARLEGTFFATEFYNPILLLPDQLKGQSVVTYGGFDAEVRSSQNADRAYIYGLSLAGRISVLSDLVLIASYNYTKGKVRTEPNETPLDHIPPTFGRVGVQYTSSKFRSELFTNFNGWKRLRNYSSSGEDNLQYATSQGMPSWYTINMRLSYEVSKNFTVQSGVDNLLDLQYRQFASGINAPGRNIFLTLRAGF